MHHEHDMGGGLELPAAAEAPQGEVDENPAKKTKSKRGRKRKAESITPSEDKPLKPKKKKPKKFINATLNFSNPMKPVRTATPLQPHHSDLPLFNRQQTRLCCKQPD